MDGNQPAADMAWVKDFFGRKDRFAASSGIELVEVSRGRAVAQMEIKECHLNGANMAHGGAIFTLADFAFAVASNSAGIVSVSISSSINYVKAAAAGQTIRAEAIELNDSPKVAAYQVRITNEDSELLAIFEGLCFRKKITLEQIDSQTN